MTPRTEAERRLLRRYAADPRGRADLARAAAVLARVHCTDVDPDRVDAILDALADELRPFAGAIHGARDRAVALADLLGVRRGLRGDGGRGDDPRNSCIECVLDRRGGLPLTLSLVWMCVGARVGWFVGGVGLPGHFVVDVRGRDGRSVLADPFAGGTPLTRRAALDLLAALHGAPVSVPGHGFRAMAPRDILLRLLRNLRSGFLRRGDAPSALAVVEDMLLLRPGLPEAHRDRALLLLEGGRRAEAVRDLRAFSEGEADGPGVEIAIRLLLLLTDAGESRN